MDKPTSTKRSCNEAFLNTQETTNSPSEVNTPKTKRNLDSSVLQKLYSHIAKMPTYTEEPSFRNFKVPSKPIWNLYLPDPETDTYKKCPKNEIEESITRQNDRNNNNQIPLQRSDLIQTKSDSFESTLPRELFQRKHAGVLHQVKDYMSRSNSRSSQEDVKNVSKANESYNEKKIHKTEHIIDLTDNDSDDQCENNNVPTKVDKMESNNIANNMVLQLKDTQRCGEETKKKKRIQSNKSCQTIVSWNNQIIKDCASNKKSTRKEINILQNIVLNPSNSDCTSESDDILNTGFLLPSQDQNLLPNPLAVQDKNQNHSQDKYKRHFSIVKKLEKVDILLDSIASELALKSSSEEIAYPSQSSIESQINLKQKSSLNLAEINEPCDQNVQSQTLIVSELAQNKVTISLSQENEEPVSASVLESNLFIDNFYKNLKASEESLPNSESQSSLTRNSSLNNLNVSEKNNLISQESGCSQNPSVSHLNFSQLSQEAAPISHNLSMLLKKIIEHSDSSSVQEIPKATSSVSIKRYRKGKVKIFRMKVLSNENQNPNKSLMEMYDELIGNCSQNNEKTFNKDLSITSSMMSYESDTFSTGSDELPLQKLNLRAKLNDLLQNQDFRDKNLPKPEVNKDYLKMKVQQTICNILNDILTRKDEKYSFTFRRMSRSNCIFEDDRLQLKPKNEGQFTTTRSEHKFFMMLLVLNQVKCLLESNLKLTQRQIYYELKEFCKNRGLVTIAVKEICCLLEVGPWSLNIVAQKGLVHGDMKITLNTGDTINCLIPGTMVPEDSNAIVEIQTTIYFILVIEKESIFKMLIEEQLPNKLTRPFLMVTGKGFPDIATQLFLKKLSVVMSVPIFILTDADPHGIKIYFNYKYGSIAHAHVSEYLAINKAQWFGMYPSEIHKFNTSSSSLTITDRKLIRRLLSEPFMHKNEKVAKELNYMLEFNMKTGIESLSKSERFLTESYIVSKILLNNF